MPRINAQVAKQPLPPKDVDLSFHGSVNLLRPVTDRAQTWLDENVDSEAQYLGDALPIEPRYTDDIVAGMIDDGLAVFVGDGWVQSIT